MRDLLSVVDLLDQGLRPAQVSVGEVVYPPGGRLGPRWQEDVQLLLLHTGSAVVSIDEIPRPPQTAGFAGLLLPGHREQFAFATTGQTHHSWVQVRLHAPPPALLQRLAALPAAIPASTALGEIVREAVNVARTPLSTASPLLGALAAAAVWRYVGDAESPSLDTRDSVINRARAFLHAHVADNNLDLRQVAAAAHVSAPHLVRRFRAELGITPIAYLWQRRLAIGVDLLVHTGLPVAAVAERSGFKSINHFSRQVRKHTGRSPTELRRQRWAPGGGSLTPQRPRSHENSASTSRAGAQPGHEGADPIPRPDFSFPSFDVWSRSKSCVAAWATNQKSESGPEVSPGG